MAETAKNIAIWIPCGFPIIIFYLFYDIYNFIINLLAKHNGCQAEMSENDSPEEIEKKKEEQMVMDIRVYNDVREILIDIYEDIKQKN